MPLINTNMKKSPDKNHSHSHGHLHEHNTSVAYAKHFALAIGLNIVFVVVEVAYGLIANSSALLADAGHNASDVLGVVFAWPAAWMATLLPLGLYTYGLRITTILVSILNAVLLFGAVAIIAWDAIEKLQNPQPVAGTQVVSVAVGGIISLGLMSLFFYKGHITVMNLIGAFLHLAAYA